MNIKATTVTGLLALGSGGYTIFPLVVDVVYKGRIVFDTCFTPVSALAVAVTILLTTLYTYLKPSPIQPKP